MLIVQTTVFVVQTHKTRNHPHKISLHRSRNLKIFPDFVKNYQKLLRRTFRNEYKYYKIRHHERGSVHG